jgi:predicted CXXCH cytochrome family protein
VLIRPIAFTVVVAGVVFVLLSALRPVYEGTRAGRPDEGYLDSGKCLSCHPAHHASWSRTFHRTMTQEARPETVRGDFERNNRLEYLGVSALMERRGAELFMTLRHPDGRTQAFRIERTVGSRRIEQYLTKQSGQYIRLPLAYDLVNRRWMSLNGSFFHPDGDNFFQHQTQWDTNCVFCHNVKAQPNFDFQRREARTEVTELGIACGACHGPAAGHAEAASSPFTRTAWRVGAGALETRIVNPAKLDPERATMVCGHCHGQRIPEPLERIREILGTGDPYDAGEDLSKYYKPVWRETKVGDYSFAARFWANGSPRLTAFEYQGLLRSACFREADTARRISCLSCHTMHGGDPKGQLTAENRTDKPCLSCHRQYESPPALAAHTGHALDSAGSRCYNCHMPRVVYGVMSIHPTHDITVPDPQLTAAEGVPNACNQCHLDQSVNWAVRAAGQMWPGRFSGARTSPNWQFDLPEGPRALFAGDALARALAAEALGGGGPAKPDPLWAGPFLVEAFGDNYPIVRFFAANALASADAGAGKPDYLASPEARRLFLESWRARFDPVARGRAQRLAEALRALRVETDIEVGE